MLLTYRSDELHRRHALRPLLAELERLERARRIELEPFDRGGADRGARPTSSASSPASELIDRLFARSEGNPLYIEELLAAGLDGRGAAPQSLRDAFMLRIERLSPDAAARRRAVAVGRATRRGRRSPRSPARARRADARRCARRVAEHVLVAGSDDRFAVPPCAAARGRCTTTCCRGSAASCISRSRGRSSDRRARRRRRRERRARDDDRHALRRRRRPARGAARHDHARRWRRATVYAYGEVAELAERALELWPRVPDASALAGSTTSTCWLWPADAHAIGRRPLAAARCC